MLTNMTIIASQCSDALRLHKPHEIVFTGMLVSFGNSTHSVMHRLRTNDDERPLMSYGTFFKSSELCGSVVGII